MTTHSLFQRLQRANAEAAATWPGESSRRQPVHTVYGGAHLFKANTTQRLGELAVRSLDEHAPSADTLADAVGMNGPGPLIDTVYRRVREKLTREPVEDFRIDFEDGYGHRPDDEEDACASQAADELARGMGGGSLPPFIGIRVKPLSAELHARSLRTLDILVTSLCAQTDGRLPGNFVVTLPKVQTPVQVEAMAESLATLEHRHKLEPGSLRMELMIETTQSIIGPDGRCALPGLVAATQGRCVAAHFGVYDYTAGCSITAHHQAMRHPACDFARHMMQVALAGTGIWLSDGATNIMPVPPHVHRAWRLHYEDVRHSLRHAYFQGWDLHPAQLPTRYAAVYAFFLESLDSASERLRNFIEQAAQATLVGDVFDDAATGQGLLNFFLRGLNCGAITESEAMRTGLTIDELRSRSFVKILAARRA